MLVIRAEQLRAFERAAEREFEEWMLGHLRSFFPGDCAAFAPGALLALVRESAAKAASHGFTTRRDVCKFVDAALLLGPRFDEEPWARQLLSSNAPARGRASALFDELRRRLGR